MSSHSSASTIPGSLLVLGGTSEIARDAVRALSGHGLDRVVLAGRSLDRLEVTRAALRHTGLEAVETAEFDADATASHEAVLREIFDTHGPFDSVLIAFGALGDPFTVDADSHEAAELITTNFNGAVSSALTSARLLADGGGGTLSIISSIAAVRPRVGNLIYGASKAGLDAFASGLRDAMRSERVHVMIIRPGFVHTAMTEGLDAAPFATTPDKVAEDIVKGYESQSDIVWSPPILKAVAPVLQMMPGKIWRLVSSR